ncbi:MAG: cytidylyltransferase domain-containing protein [Planctomycetota bacterium]
MSNSERNAETGGSNDHGRSSRTNHDVVAIIIGRAGSRGVPNKNIMPLGGVPMVWHSIRIADDARCVNSILVSTDSEELMRQARDCPCRTLLRTIERPSLLATDSASVQDTVRHAVLTAESLAPVIVVLYCNVPVRPADLIDRAVERLIETGADSVQSYVPSGKHHPSWQITLGKDDRTQPWSTEVPHRRQNLIPAYAHDGGIIAVTRNALFRLSEEGPHAFLGRDRRAIINEPGDVVDIDDAFDLVVAAAAIEYRETRQRCERARSGAFLP